MVSPVEVLRSGSPRAHGMPAVSGARSLTGEA